MMKKMALIMASAAAFAALVTAAPSQAYACYCEARSSSAWGWGQHGSCARAQAIALTNCAVRTPRGYYCYVTFCR